MGPLYTHITPIVQYTGPCNLFGSNWYMFSYNNCLNDVSTCVPSHTLPCSGHRAQHELSTQTGWSSPQSGKLQCATEQAGAAIHIEAFILD